MLFFVVDESLFMLVFNHFPPNIEHNFFEILTYCELLFFRRRSCRQCIAAAVDLFFIFGDIFGQFLRLFRSWTNCSLVVIGSCCVGGSLFRIYFFCRFYCRFWKIPWEYMYLQIVMDCWFFYSYCEYLKNFSFQ